MPPQSSIIIGSTSVRPAAIELHSTMAETFSRWSPSIDQDPRGRVQPMCRFAAAQ
jgi:hypothetical protein